MSALNGTWHLLVLVAGIVCAIVAVLISTGAIGSGDWRDWIGGAIIAGLVSRLP